MRLRRRPDEIQREIDFHIGRATDDYVAFGLTREEARRRALAEFGSMTSVFEQCREVARGRWLDSMARDLRYAWRMLRNDRGYSAAAIAALGLGLGANIAVFTLFDAVALRPLDMPAPTELVELSRSTPDVIGGLFSYPDYLFLRDRVAAFRGVAAMSAAHLHLVGRAGPIAPFNTEFAGIRAPHTLGDAQPLLGLFVSANYFSVMQVAPVRGRIFSQIDEQQIAGPFAALLSEEFWRRRFGGDETIVGSRLTFSAIPTVIVGIVPAGHRGTRPQVPDVWLPLGAQQPLARRAADARSLCCQILARLAAGQTVARAQSAVVALTASLPSFALSDVRPVVSVAPAVPYGRNRRAFQVLFSAILQPAIALVLLIACANAAALALGRAAARRREIAMRLALGATRWRILQQLLTEGVLIAMTAAAAGLVVARWLVGVAATAGLTWLANSGFTDGGTVLLDVRLRPTVVWYSLSLALVAGFAFALPAAMQMLSQDVAPAIADRASTAARRRSRLRGWMVGAQLAICLALLIGAASLVAGSFRVLSLDIGVDTAHVVDLTLIDPHELGRSDAATAAVRADVIARTAGLSGVRDVAVASRVPLGGPLLMELVRPRDMPGDDPAGAGPAALTFVSAAYFSTLGIPLTAGRPFAADEAGSESPVAIVSASLAKRLWADGTALGRLIEIGSVDRARFQYTRDVYVQSAMVVGVAADIRSISALTPDAGAVYLPEQRAQWPAHILVRTRDTAAVAAPSIAARVARMNPELAVSFQPLDETLRTSAEFVLARLGAMLFGGIGAMGALLACLGVYSLIGYSVAQQLRELAIRIALGASRDDVLWLVFVRNCRPVAGGLAAGCVLGVIAARVLAAFVPSTRVASAAAVLGATCALGAVAIGAALIPARHAVTLDPSSILRME